MPLWHGQTASARHSYPGPLRLEGYAKNGGIFITESNGLEVGGIANGLSRGLETGGSSGDIEVRVLDGMLSITHGIKTHMNGVTRLRAAGNMMQTGSGLDAIESAALGVVSDLGTVNLSSSANDVNHLAAHADYTDQSVYFQDRDDLYVHEVSMGGVFDAAVIGVNGRHDVELKAVNYLAAERPILAGGGLTDTIRLRSVFGAVGQTAQGRIAAGNLSVQAGTVINLPAANNDVDVFAAAAGVGPVVFNDLDGKTIGTVEGGVLITNTVTGVTP